MYRHPLQEQTVDTFVPNDILVVGGAGIGSYPAVHGEGDDLMSEGSLRGNSVVICTGANACGKVKKPKPRYIGLPKSSNAFVDMDGQSVYLKQVRSLAKMFFSETFWTPIRLLCWDHKDRVDTVNGSSEAFSLPVMYLVPVENKQHPQIGWCVYTLRASPSVSCLPI